MRHIAAALPRELAHGLARLRGRYDLAIATLQSLAPPHILLSVPRTSDMQLPGDHGPRAGLLR